MADAQVNAEIPKQPVDLKVAFQKREAMIPKTDGSPDFKLDITDISFAPNPLERVYVRSEVPDDPEKQGVREIYVVADEDGNPEKSFETRKNEKINYDISNAGTPTETRHLSVVVPSEHGERYRVEINSQSRTSEVKVFKMPAQPNAPLVPISETTNKKEYDAAMLLAGFTLQSHATSVGSLAAGAKENEKPLIQKSLQVVKQIAEVYDHVIKEKYAPQNTK